MTLQKIKSRVADIEARASDDEAAHSMEDRLRDEFIAFVAEGNDKLAHMAKEVLRTNDFDFARWCA